MTSEIAVEATGEAGAVMAGPGNAAAGKITGAFSERVPSGTLSELVSVLRGLDSGETDSDTARRWASVDLFGIFLGDVDASPVASGGFWRFLDAMVQVGVFIPIAVTWIGLETAAWAYRNAENAGTLGGESFLQGWERGFGELPAGLTFDWFATYTCVLVTLLVAATAAQLQHRWRVDQAEAELRRRLTEALVGADLVLAPYRLPGEQRAARELDVAADKVAALVSAFDDATGKMNVTAGAVGAAADKMKATAGAFGRATGAMTVAADKVTATAGAFDTSVGKLGSVAGAVSAAADKVTATAGAVDTTAVKMNATAGTFDATAGSMITAADKLAATVVVIDSAAGTMTATTGAIKSAADLAVASQQEATRAITLASTAIAGAESAAVAATAAAGVLEVASNRLGNDVGKLTTATGQARDSLAEVADSVGGHTSRVEAAANVLDHAQHAINVLPTAVTALQSEITAVASRLAALQHVTTAMTGLKESLDATGSASDRIAAAFTDGSESVRDFLIRTNATAADTAGRMEFAVDILGKAHQTIDTLPVTINALAREVTDLSGQLTNLTEVTKAVGELRASLDRLRISLETSRPGRRAAPKSPPPPTRLTSIFKAFRKQKASYGN